MNEEARAAQYREQSARQRAYRAARLLVLAGDPAAAAAVRDAWCPLYEEVKGLEPPGPLRFPEDECAPPLGPPPRILDYTGSH